MKPKRISIEAGAIILLVLASSRLAPESRGELPRFVRAVDLSFLQQLEAAGATFKSEGHIGDPMQILMSNGVNCVRLRLWHTPAGGWNNLSNTLVVAERARNMGMAVLLDIHYSDTWGDPGQQAKPSAWTSLSPAQLKDTVRNYTGNVVSNFADHGVLPDGIQIGNEITSGFLWNDGRVGGSYETNWTGFTDLLKSAIEGVTNALQPTDHVDIILHIDRGGDNPGSRWFFDHITSYDVPFDIIGLSYYPWWHGALEDLEDNITDLAMRYHKDILVMETAYPWTLDWSDSTQNIVGETPQLMAGFAATPAGQQDFLCAIRTILMQSELGHGRGFCYWAADYVATDSVGSSWENLALFDFQTNLLAGAQVFADTDTVCMPKFSSLSKGDDVFFYRLSNLIPGTTTEVWQADSLVNPTWYAVTGISVGSWAPVDVGSHSATQSMGFIRLEQ